MVNCIGLVGVTLSSAISVIVSLSLATYLILIGCLRGHFRQYAILYMYLLTTITLTAMGAIFLAAFGRDHNVYAWWFYSTKAPLTLFKFLVVCWLYWVILSRDYPSIRFSFLLVFLTTVAVFLLYFALLPRPNLSHEVLTQATYYIEKYFMTAQILLLFVLGLVIVGFRLQIGDHLRGIVLGLSASYTLSLGYDMLKHAFHSPIISYLHPVPYLSMLLIFCYYLSSKQTADSQCTAGPLKALDERCFHVLAAAGLYNRLTDQLFFGFFDLQDPTDFERWKRHRRK